MIVLRNCLVCKKEFYTKNSPSLVGRGKYCSRKCQWISLKERIKSRYYVNCLICGNKVYAPPSKIKKGQSKYCSQICYGKSNIGKISKKNRQISKQCRICGNLFKIKPSDDLVRFCCSRKCKGVEARQNFKEEKNPNWKGGITPIAEKIRKLPRYNEWRISIFLRDKHTCQICGKYDYNKINADHYPTSFSKIISNFRIRNIEQALNTLLFWDINNGRTLCIDCHKKTETYAKNFTKGIATSVS